MNTMIAQVRDILERAPLVTRALALMLVLVAYSGGLLAVEALSGGNRLPVLLVAVFFLPAVLRSWLQLYWQVRRDLGEHLSRHHHRMI